MSSGQKPRHPEHFPRMKVRGGARRRQAGTRDLAQLEQQVIAKLAAALPEWPVADDPIHIEPWGSPTDLPVLPADWPQFPSEQWVIYPARRAYCLVLADHLIDLGQLAEAGFLIECGGKVRVA